MVSVDQPRSDDAAVAPDHVIARAGRNRSDLGYALAFDGNIAGPPGSSQNPS
jgi:hypothetical protein